MTSAAGTTQHPDVCEISDLAEGLLPAPRATDMRQHLSGCTVCTDIRDSLAEIRELLSALPTPPQMPGDIADRIVSALVSAAPSGTTARKEARHVSRETSPASRAGGSTPAHGPASRAPEPSPLSTGDQRRRGNGAFPGKAEGSLCPYGSDGLQPEHAQRRNRCGSTLLRQEGHRPRRKSACRPAGDV
jgi:hypothetical protein